MAASDNQGMQIGLIITVILALIMSGLTFWFWNGWEKSHAEAEESSTQLSQERTAHGNTTRELRQLKQWVGGVAEDAPIADVESQYNKDMEKLGTFPQDKRTYTQALQYISDSLDDKNRQLDEAQSNLIALEATYQKEKETLQNLNEMETQRADQAVNDLNQAKADYMAQLTQQRDQMNAVKANMEETNRSTQEQLELADQQNQELRQQLDKALGDFRSLKVFSNLAHVSTEALLKVVKDETVVAYLNEVDQVTFEIPDGEVYRSWPAKGVVWINLGSADKLQRQTTFSVYAMDINDVKGGSAQRKGSIEVTRILGDRLAEAKVVEDALADPILPGDKIFTPAWHPGRTEHFALGGSIDLDGDTRDDREMVRSIILRNGGIIDADDHVDAPEEITVKTRYFVRGELPEGDETWFPKYTQMSDAANDQGVEKISVAELFDMMGQREVNRVLQYGRYAVGDAFLQEGRETPKVAPGLDPKRRFRDRRPLRSRTSAYDK